ncbi:MAG: hypothetical protein QW350_01635 [Candidatus Aenigmatarchaeota archaeon]|nr:hypothetical protein [Candidatus Aenigmarchaeota archaeon]
MRLILLYLLIIPIVVSTMIEVSVVDFINADVIGLKHEDYGRATRISFEVFNSGSVECKAAFRMDVSKEKYSFTAWSDKIIFRPNNRKNIEFYWFPLNSTGNFTVKIKYYCANEIKEIKEFYIKNENYLYEQPTIDIISPKFFENKIVFHIKTNSTGEFIIIPSEYPKDWRIEQKKIYIKNNWPKYVELEYEKDFWKVGKINLMVVGKNGEYGIKTVEIKKEPLFNEITFKITSFINRIFFG